MCPKLAFRFTNQSRCLPEDNEIEKNDKREYRRSSTKQQL